MDYILITDGYVKDSKTTLAKDVQKWIAGLAFLRILYVLYSVLHVMESEQLKNSLLDYSQAYRLVTTQLLLFAISLEVVSFAWFLRPVAFFSCALVKALTQ